MVSLSPTNRSVSAVRVERGGIFWISRLKSGSFLSVFTWIKIWLSGVIWGVTASSNFALMVVTPVVAAVPVVEPDGLVEFDKIDVVGIRISVPVEIFASLLFKVRTRGFERIFPRPVSSIADN